MNKYTLVTSLVSPQVPANQNKQRNTPTEPRDKLAHPEHSSGA
jgi:hypothetical protein